MLKNKAQIAREGIKTTLELPGPLSGPLTPAESEFGSVLVMCVLAHNLLRPPPKWKSWIRPCLCTDNCRIMYQSYVNVFTHVDELLIKSSFYDVNNYNVPLIKAIAFVETIDGFTDFMHTILTKVVHLTSWELVWGLSDVATTNVCKVDSKYWNSIVRYRLMKWLVTRSRGKNHP